MKSMLVSICIVAVASSLSGCAYFTTYTKQIDLKQASYALDVKQRVVLSTTRNNPQKENSPIDVICAEPSPDALTVISASAGIGAASEISAGANRATENLSANGNRSSASNAGNTASNQNVNVAAALAEQGAFVGLRTQSIQLLRDTMYRLCEGYANSAVSDEEFTSMQRRYQSTMMGLLAIEQLTRPVVAAQVVLASTATSKSGPSAADNAVESARERLDLKEADLTKAKIAFDEKKQAETNARELLNDNIRDERSARESAASAHEDEAAKRQAAEVAAKPFIDARPDMQRALKDASGASIGQATALQAAQRAVDRAAAEVGAARSAAMAETGGSANIGAIRDASARITAELTVGVTRIVEEINRSYSRDGCFALIQRLVKNSDVYERWSPVLDKAMQLCSTVLGADNQALVEQIRRIPSAPVPQAPR